MSRRCAVRLSFIKAINKKNLGESRARRESVANLPGFAVIHRCTQLLLCWQTRFLAVMLANSFTRKSIQDGVRGRLIARFAPLHAVVRDLVHCVAWPLPNTQRYRVLSASEWRAGVCYRLLALGHSVYSAPGIACSSRRKERCYADVAPHHVATLAGQRPVGDRIDHRHRFGSGGTARLVAEDTSLCGSRCTAAHC
jgi:hypothetical protein